MENIKVALIYDRVNKWGGAERVLMALHEMFPKAYLYTSVYNSDKASWAKVFPKVVSSFVQKIPFAKESHEYFPYLMPLAFETLQLTAVDLVISVTSEAAKGVFVKPSTKHICYCLTPTRYLWSGYKDYFKNPVIRFTAKPVISYLRFWDKIAAQRPDKMIAISSEVSKRIKKYYKRTSTVIYPPVNVDFFANPALYTSSLRSDVLKEGNYYLIVSRLVPYKKVDLAIRAFNELGNHLLIVGTGSEERKLKRLAKKNTKFLGFLTDDKLAFYYQNAKALIHVQDEDFGIAPVEAQAAGTPVIAYRKGGAVESVIDGVTGIFFNEQSKEVLVDAVKRFARMKFDTEKIINNAHKFSEDRFKEKFMFEVNKFINL